MTVSMTNDCVTIEVVGDFDRAAVKEFEDAVRQQMARASVVVADVSGSSLIASAALAAIVRLHHSAVERDARFEVLIAPGTQQRLFDIAGLSDYLNLAVGRLRADR